MSGEGPAEPQGQEGDYEGGGRPIEADERTPPSSVPTTSSPVPSASQPEGNGDLMKEAVQLLKCLKPTVKSVKVGSLNNGSHTRALMDRGATRILRPARSTEEYNQAVPIKVELAAGEATLRQVQSTGT